ncbi:DinB family protein [Amycolatopsis halotolerans]|uniref:DinB family protein n=2 Tax=Amycolatopsis halotolerans TaxID=330083 RepID=A0ABV7QQH8_9PSEU
MAGKVSPTPDERGGLLGFLAQQRQAVKTAAYGLTDEQARAVPSASALSVGGLLKHVSSTESDWIDHVLRIPPKPFAESMATYQENYRLGPDETLESAIAAYDQVAARTEEVIAGVEDLNQEVPVPKDVPWFPDDVSAWSVRWVLLHLIEETARHAGHTDIVRESLDGATAMPLQAAAEGWPETDWLKPWKPAE